MTTLSTLFTISILLIVVANTPSALALIINGVPITQVALGGNFYCSMDGNPISSGPSNILPGVRVDLRCGDGNDDQLLKSTFTDLSGKYFFIFNMADALPFDLRNCFIEVKMPLVRCILSPETGLLRASISQLSVFQIMLGNLLVGLVGPFQPVLP